MANEIIFLFSMLNLSIGGNQQGRVRMIGLLFVNVTEFSNGQDLRLTFGGENGIFHEEQENDSSLP